MQVRGVRGLSYRDITSTRPVQKRLEIAKQALQHFTPGMSVVLSCSNLAICKIREAVATETDLTKLGAYLCFGGDVASLVFGLGIREAMCLDQWPMFNEAKLRVAQGHIGEYYVPNCEPPDYRLVATARAKQQDGFVHNLLYAWHFQEVALNTFFEILGLRATNLKVFAAIDQPTIFKVDFDWHRASYCLYIVQEKLSPETMPNVLAQEELGIVMIKSGDIHQPPDTPGAEPFSPQLSYLFLNAQAGRFAPNTLILSDRKIVNPRLWGATIFLSQGLSFGYANGRSYFSRVI